VHVKSNSAGTRNERLSGLPNLIYVSGSSKRFRLEMTFYGVVVEVVVVDVLEVEVELLVVVLVNERRLAIPGSDVSATGAGGPAKEIAPLSVKVTNPLAEQTQNCVPAGSGWSLALIARGVLNV
jgi:hypothetical protein